MRSLRSAVPAVVSLLVVSAAATLPVSAQGFSAWSAPVNVAAVNTTAFEG